MSPVVKTGTGSFTAITLQSISRNFHIKGRILYTPTGLTSFFKYVLNDAGTVADFASGFNVKDDIPAGFSNMFGIDVGGVSYIILLAQGSSNSYLYRYTDTGAGFSSFTTLDTSDNLVVYHSIGASPKPTCTDGVLNQEETSIDCGGPNCGGCAIGKACNGDGDCLGNKCTNNVCCKSFDLRIATSIKIPFL